uniref:G-protein coupled receptors family 1 profile domain-containing protein n=2 Tax=Meloidogyne TaxID=189290 RepID=A0A914MZU7_MELIC
MIQEKLTTTTMSTILSRIQMETIQPLPTTPIAHQNRCLTEEQMQMHGSEFEWYLQRYLFPSLVIFGILGNALNLSVLLDKKMQSRANTFLAMLAFADIFFLSLLVPNILANYSIFSRNWHFRMFYLSAKVHLISLANWASAVAIWCVIAVCTDRLIGIRNPLAARGHITRRKMVGLICAIVAVPGLLTAHQHVAHVCLVRAFCNGSQLYSKCLPVNQERWFAPNQSNPYSETFRKFISVSTLLNVLFSIIFPIIVLAILNTMLLCALRRRSKQLNNLNRNESWSQKQHKNVENGESLREGSKQPLSKFSQSSSHSSEGLNQHLLHAKTEQRVTITVALIVSMFTLTNGPSAIVHLLQNLLLTGIDQREWYNATLVCSALVIFGKASNFILFCLFSKHFRRRLFALAQKRVHKRLASSVGMGNKGGFVGGSKRSNYNKFRGDSSNAGKQ